MKQRSLTRLGVACTAVTVGLAIGAVPAFADATPPGFNPAPTTASAMPVLPAIASGTRTVSQYLAGYDVTPTEGLSSDGATFTLPRIASCASSTDYEAISLGEQLTPAAGDQDQPGGATDAAAGAYLYCTPGSGLQYELDAFVANTTTGNSNNYLPANPGDVVQTRIELTSGGQTVVTTTDETTGQTQTVQEPTATDDEGQPSDTQFYEGISPAVGYEQQNCSDGGTCTYNIPKFSSVRFSASQVGSLHLDQVSSTEDELDQDGPVQIVPGAISPSAPGAFTLTEKHDN